MSLFSDERVEQLAEKFYNELQKRKLIKQDTKLFLFKAEIKKAYINFYRLNESIDSIVKKRLTTMLKTEPENTQKYKVLYEKNFIEEWKKY